MVFANRLGTVGTVGGIVGGLLGGGGTSTGTSGSTGTTGTGSAKADPIVSSFDGRTFEFFGKVGGFYNVIQDADHQVSMRLKLGTVTDHDGGTYIDGIGFAYQSHRVIVELNSDDSVQVILDGEKLHMGDLENSQAHELTTSAGTFRLMWQLFRPTLGNTVELTTDLLSLTIYRTDAGSLDKNGVPQPAFLNFDAKLNHPPAHEMQGIVGEGYTRVLGAEKLPDDGVFYPATGASIASYEMPGYFDAHARGSGLSFGGAAYAHSRILIQDRLGADVTDIVAKLDAAALPVAHAGGGRFGPGGRRALLLRL
ncbi:g9203 [Coccomyxa elongata]